MKAKKKEKVDYSVGVLKSTKDKLKAIADKTGMMVYRILDDLVTDEYDKVVKK